MKKSWALAVRLLGALITFASVAVGIRAMGAEQFGVSVILTGAGTLIALPATAQERLILRLAATEEHHNLRTAQWRAARLLAASLATGAIICMFLPGVTSTWLGVLASCAYAVSTAWIVCRQAELRGQGEVFWGQGPLELIRPALTLVVYLAVSVAVPQEMQGGMAVLLIALLSAPPLLMAPRPARALAVGPDPGSGQVQVRVRMSASLSLAVQSAVATGLERGVPIVLGIHSGHGAVAVFAVVLKVIQLANAGQAFALYVAAPDLARLRKSRSGGARDAIGQIVKKIRLVGLVTALPVVIVCIFLPQWVARFAGIDVDLRGILLLATAGIIGVLLFGPASAILSTGPHEGVMAACHVAALVVGAGVLAFTSGLWAAVSFLVLCQVAWNLFMWLSVRRVFGTWA